MEKRIEIQHSKLLFIIAMVIIFCFGVGLSYAYFSNSKSVSNTLSFGKLKVIANGASKEGVFVYGTGSVNGKNKLLVKGDTIEFKGSVALEEGSVNAYVRLKFDDFKYYNIETATEITDMNSGYKNLLSQSILSAVAMQNSEWAYKESGGYQYLYYGNAMKAGEVNKYSFDETITIIKNFVPTAFSGVEVQFNLVVEAIQANGAVDEDGNSVNIVEDVATVENAKQISKIIMWDEVFPSQIEKNSVTKLRFEEIGSATENIVGVGGYSDNFGEIAIPEYVKQVKNGEVVSYEWTNERRGSDVYKVTSILGGSFNQCSNLTSITIPRSLTSIESSLALRACNDLVNISVDEENLKYNSKNNCNAIIETETNTLIIGCKNTVIPESVTSIGEQAFLRNESLEYIEIPSNVKIIGDSAFVDCASLTSVKFDESSQLTSIGNSAFTLCRSLTNIIIPSSVTSIEHGAFSGCTSLTTINYKGTQEEWNNISNISFAGIPTKATINYDYAG